MFFYRNEIKNKACYTWKVKICNFIQDALGINNKVEVYAEIHNLYKGDGTERETENNCSLNFLTHSTTQRHTLTYWNHWVNVFGGFGGGGVVLSSYFVSVIQTPYEHIYDFIVPLQVYGQNLWDVTGGGVSRWWG